LIDALSRSDLIFYDGVWNVALVAEGCNGRRGAGSPEPAFNAYPPDSTYRWASPNNRGGREMGESQSSSGFALMPILLFLLVVTFLDDVRGLLVLWWLLVQFAAAGGGLSHFTFCLARGLSAQSWRCWAVLAIVWMTNLYILWMVRKVWPVPQKLVEAGFKAVGESDLARWLCGSLQLDISKARTELDCRPPAAVSEGQRRTAEFFLWGRS